MKYSKIFQYAYLVFGVLFAFDAISKFIESGEIVYPSILLAALAVFMFFFREKFRKKYNKSDESN